uniref:Putative filament-like plant protein 7 isoform X1 n=1 Tax=Davidia involucrata TaxID=16924 RepID=A0A5B7ASS7_DAVIN
MDHKTWLWRKRSSEKTIVTNEKRDEVMIPTEKEADLERSVKNLNEKLASVLHECSTKDDLVAKHAKTAEEATAGREKAEVEVVFLKQELDEASQQRVAANERLTHLNAALKEYMQQLSSVREEQEQRVHDAVMKTSREFEKSQIKLEEKYTETSKRLANLTVENTQLSKALLVKEKLIEDLSRRKCQAEAEFNTLMGRLDSIEKENAFLKYEFRVLEKELEIRNEEKEFNRRSADASHKQHLESVKKITKLEAECQRLRVLVRKRLPGPAALAKMKSEVDMQGRNQMDMRRRKLSPLIGGLVVRDATRENPPEIPSKKISFLIERLYDVEEENKLLKEILAKKDNELHSSRIMCALTASKLSQVEALPGQLSKGQKSMELTRCSSLSNELSLTSGFDIGNDNETIGSGSWASALISELENFRHGETKNTPEHRTIGVSDMSLMDDFVEMERLAIVSIDSPFGSSCISSDTSHALSDSLAKDSSGYHLDTTGKELVPVVQVDSVDSEQDIQTRDVSTGEPCYWLQHVLKVILDQNRVSKRSLNELLEDIRIALACMNHPTATEGIKEECSKNPGASEPLPISGYITWKSPNSSPRVNTCNGISGIDTSVEKTSNENIQSNLSRSICKLIELIKKICPTSLKDGNTSNNWSERDHCMLANNNSATPAEYSVCVFQWKCTELSTVLQHFVHTCNDLLNGKANLEKFAGELTSALDWIVNNCIAFQDVSSARDKIQKHFGWDGSQSESELGVDCTFSESDKAHKCQELLLCLPFDTSSNSQNVMFETEKIQTKLLEENRGLKNELKNMESSQKDLEARLQSANDKSEALIKQLQESEQSFGSLKTELETLQESKGMIEDQIENQKLLNEDLDTQITVAKVKLNEVLQKFSSLEVELEDKSHCCEELEATCLELQLQLESVANKETPKDHIDEEEKLTPEDNIDEEEKLLQTGWEITAASAKLAECQETILNLGKQLKALTSSREEAVFDKVFSTTTNKKLSQRSSLRDQMLAEDDAGAENLKSPKTKEIVSTVEIKRPSMLHSDSCNTLSAPSVRVEPPKAYLGSKHEGRTAADGALAIVPSKKRGGGGLLRRLLLRRKRGSSKKASAASLSFAK